MARRGAVAAAAALLVASLLLGSALAQDCSRLPGCTACVEVNATAGGGRFGGRMLLGRGGHGGHGGPRGGPGGAALNGTLPPLPAGGFNDSARPPRPDGDSDGDGDWNATGTPLRHGPHGFDFDDGAVLNSTAPFAWLMAPLPRGANASALLAQARRLNATQAQALLARLDTSAPGHFSFNATQMQALITRDNETLHHFNGTAALAVGAAAAARLPRAGRGLRQFGASAWGPRAMLARGGAGRSGRQQATAASDDAAAGTAPADGRSGRMGPPHGEGFFAGAGHLTRLVCTACAAPAYVLADSGNRCGERSGGGRAEAPRRRAGAVQLRAGRTGPAPALQAAARPLPRHSIADLFPTPPPPHPTECAPGYGMPRPDFNGTAPAQPPAAPPASERCPAGQVSSPNAPALAVNGTAPAGSEPPRRGGMMMRGGRQGGLHGRMCVACPDGTAANADQTACV
jgi:hypothetical protein